MLSVAESWFDSVSMADMKDRGSSSQRTTVSCAVLFRWLKAVLAEFPASAKGRTITEIDGIASFHISKQVVSYTVSSFFWLLGIVILPVQFRKVKDKAQLTELVIVLAVEKGKALTWNVYFSGSCQPLKVM